jgi:hypothetical protein
MFRRRPRKKGFREFQRRGWILIDAISNSFARCRTVPMTSDDSRGATREIEALKRARENFVRKRREMAEQMIPTGAAAPHFAPSFVALQAVIEAIDRAIKDEESLPDGYASGEPEPEPPTVGTASNVVDVNFDSA